MAEGLTYHGGHPPQNPKTGDCYTFTDGVMYVFDGKAWVRFIPARAVRLSLPENTEFMIPAYRGIRDRRPTGRADGQQCPVWLPQDPNVRHENRTRCVRWGPHTEHTDTYLIEEQTLD